MSPLSDRIWLVVLTVNIITRASHIAKEVIAVGRRINGSKSECFCVWVIAAIRHHAEAPRNRLGDIMHWNVSRINGKVLTQFVKRSGLCSISQRVFPQSIEPFDVM